MRPKLLYAAAAALALVELVILAGALHPTVSDTFRARYIAGTSDCWEHDVSGAYELGTRISTRIGEGDRLRNLLRCGWLDPEDNGTWSRGGEAKLRFKLPATRNDLVLDLEMSPYRGETRGIVQHVIVSAGGRELAQFTLDTNITSIQRIPVPADLPLDAEGRLDVTLAIPTAVSPRDLGINADRRPLGIRLASLRLWDGSQ